MALSKLPRACYDKLKVIVDRVKGVDLENDACVVAACDEIESVCTEYSMLYKSKHIPKQVGIHPKNRDGEGFSLLRCISRGKKIKNLGWSWKVVSMDAYAFEDHPTHRHIAKYSAEQNRLYPDMSQFGDNVKLGPAGATHCNHWLAMLMDERPCHEPSISEFGRMSKRLCFKDKGIELAATTGIEWKVFRWEVEEAFPEIPRIVASARNAVAQMHEGGRRL